MQGKNVRIKIVFRVDNVPRKCQFFEDGRRYWKYCIAPIQKMRKYGLRDTQFKIVPEQAFSSGTEKCQWQIKMRVA